MMLLPDSNSGNCYGMASRRLRTLLMLLMISLCVCSAQTQSKVETGIEGVIMVAPIRPGPIKAGEERPQSAPLPNAVFNVADEQGRVTSFTTDSQGRFRVSLTPGHYAVSLAEHRFPYPCGPFDLNVVTGKMTKVEWQCDSGMR
jgi:hypothetical protein